MRSFESLHYKLFSIPQPTVMFTISLLSALLLSFVDIKLLMLWIGVFLVALLLTRMAKLWFDVKRISFLAILISTISLPAVVLKGSIAASSFLLFITLYFCSEKKGLSIALSALPYIAIEPNLATLAILALSVLLLLLYLRFLDIEIGAVNVKEFVESFVPFWLTSNAEYIENFLIGRCEKIAGRVRCLSAGSANVISTDFHPGPFRNVGGARLVRELSTGNRVYLHSPTSHAKNPVSASDVAEIAHAVKCSGKTLKPLKPFAISGENFDVYCFPFDGLRLIFVSGKRHLDDFMVASQHFVVDCHNAYEAGYDPNERDVGEILELVRRAERKESSEVGRVRSAFVKLEVETESICSYVAALLLEFDDERYAVVVFDANNIDLRFREYIESAFEEIGYTAIVASTDNHEKTGVRAKQSYKPAGGCDEDWKVADMLVEKCRSVELEEAEFRYYESCVEIRVMGERMLKDSEIAASEKAAPLIAKFLGFTVLSYFAAVGINLI